MIQMICTFPNFEFVYLQVLGLQRGTRYRSWFRHCAESVKVAGSISDGVGGILHWPNPSDRTMALGSTHHLTDVCTRDISWVKGGRCVGLTTLPRLCAYCLEILWAEPPGAPRACRGLYKDSFTDCWDFSSEERGMLPADTHMHASSPMETHWWIVRIAALRISYRGKWHVFDDLFVPLPLVTW
jgi:hypothetical protein